MDDIQNKLNQMSLVMTIPEDIVKACKANNLSPAFIETMLRLHDQQVQLETAINSLRSVCNHMAEVISTQSEFHEKHMQLMNDMAKHVGYGSDEMVTSEELGQG